MKKKTEPDTEIIYPFDSFNLQRLCHKCNHWIRYSALHERFYVVSELAPSEILHINHECSKDKSKESRKYDKHRQK